MIATGTAFAASCGAGLGAGQDEQALQAGAEGGGLNTPRTRRTTSPTAPSAMAVTMTS